MDAAADCLGLDNLVDQELLAGEANERVFQVPAVKMEAVGWFRTDAVQHLRGFARLLRRRRILRQGEICEFEEFYEVVLGALEGVERALFEDFYYQKANP